VAELLNIVFSVILIAAGMALLQRSPKAKKILLFWSALYIVFTIGVAVVNWIPRMDLVKQNTEVKGMFLAQIVISMPLYLVLPVFLLIYLNRKQTQNEVSLWR
jgi:predicted acyltransferase